MQVLISERMLFAGGLYDYCAVCVYSTRVVQVCPVYAPLETLQELKTQLSTRVLLQGTVQ